jgi:hypothetical protein
MNTLFQKSKISLLLMALLSSLTLLTAWAEATQSANPKWVDELIQKFQSDPVGNPPQSIWRYEYNGQTVYYVPPQCCDQYSTLYDATGNVICAPDGGIDGKGDGKCPDFASKRSNEQLVWKDARPR